jgi:hypothetical protein
MLLNIKKDTNYEPIVDGDEDGDFGPNFIY